MGRLMCRLMERRMIALEFKDSIKCHNKSNDSALYVLDIQATSAFI